MSLIERKVVDKEIQSMLTKEVLREVQPSRDQFLSTIFVRPKKGENKFRPIIIISEWDPGYLQRC